MRRPRIGARKPAAAGLDRGRGVHGAKWCLVTPTGDMLNYAQLREQIPDEKAWKRWRKSHSAYELFKSQREAKRWIALLVMQETSAISGLCRQVRQPLLVRNPDGLNVQIGVYIADHVYLEPRADNPDLWDEIVEDVKGYKEDLYLWKRRHFEAQYGRQIREV